MDFVDNSGANLEPIKQRLLDYNAQVASAETGSQGDASPELPIIAFTQEIQETARANSTFLVIGETGSGKSTRLPLILHDTLGPEDRIAITQPRRVAARSVAKYVAEQVGCEIGGEVGYTVRFDDQTTEDTRINFMTDGILLRQIQTDPLLRQYTAVMIDEVHERSLNIDFTLGLLKKLQTEREAAGLPPLKIIVTSATLEKEKLSAYFQNSPVVEIPGRMYKVESHYESVPVVNYPAAAARKTRDIIHSGKDGDILIFMPGVDEINRTIDEIKNLGVTDVEILPLHGQLSPEDQDLIFEPGTIRKIIVSSPIAETSVTVPGVRHVIDSGQIKQVEYDAETGIESLVVTPHAQSGCIQRKGRAGRVARGDYYGLYTEADFNGRRKFQLPEIQRKNLAGTVLTMKKIGIDDVEAFEFIDQPDKATFHKAVETLTALGALDEDGNLTELGIELSHLPLEPHIGRMIIEARKHGCVNEVATVAAFLGARNVFIRPKGEERDADQAHAPFKDTTSDFITLLNVWKEYQDNSYSARWASSNFLNSKALVEIRDIRMQLLRILRNTDAEPKQPAGEDAIRKAIASGLIENLLEQDSGYMYRLVGNSKYGIQIHPSSGLFKSDPTWMVSAQIITTSKTYARMCQSIDPKWLQELAPHLIEERSDEAVYDVYADKITQSVRHAIKGSTRSIKHETHTLEGEQATHAFAQVLAKGNLNFPFVAHNKNVFEEVVRFYRRSQGTSHKPLDQSHLEAVYEERLGNISSKKALEEAIQQGTVDLNLNIDSYISQNERNAINQDNPEVLIVNGHNYPVTYTYDHYRTPQYYARIKADLTTIFSLNEVPHIPSGISSVVVLYQDMQSYAISEGRDLESLKSEAARYHVREQWDAWRAQQTTQNVDTAIVLNGEVMLPDKVQFGTHPITQDIVYAYPALYANTDGWRPTGTYSIQYFPSEKEAEAAQSKSESAIHVQRLQNETALRDEISKEEISTITSELQRLLANIKARGSTMATEDWNRLNTQIGWALMTERTNPTKTLAELRDLKVRVIRCLQDYGLTTESDTTQSYNPQSFARPNSDVYGTYAPTPRVPGFNRAGNSNSPYASYYSSSHAPVQPDRVVGPSKYDQNRDAFAKLVELDSERRRELAQAQKAKNQSVDVRMSELATVIDLVNRSLQDLSKASLHLDVDFPHMQGAKSRIQKLAKECSDRDPGDQLSNNITEAANKFVALRAALSVTQRLAAEWVGNDPELQNTAFHVFLTNLAHEIGENAAIKDAVENYKASQPIPQPLEDLFIQSAEQL